GDRGAGRAEPALGQRHRQLRAGVRAGPPGGPADAELRQRRAQRLRADLARRRPGGGAGGGAGGRGAGRGHAAATARARRRAPPGVGYPVGPVRGAGLVGRRLSAAHAGHAGGAGGAVRGAVRADSPARRRAFRSNRRVTMSQAALPALNDTCIAVVGLGYVGLPLAVEFGKQYDTVGFDINTGRIAELRSGRDSTLEVEAEELEAAGRLRFTSELEDIRGCHVYIVTVPTPIDSARRPDLRPLVKASEALGKVLKRGDIVVYESTVYPGCTEEVCIPILERVSGLKFNEDFHAGYSPERINPGDKQHRVTTIKKVTSG